METGRAERSVIYVTTRGTDIEAENIKTVEEIFQPPDL
jgi:hypothetical protein